MKILLSGSGSGGHIYPCIALYRELAKEHQVYLIIFKEIDKKIYGINHIDYYYIDDQCSNLKKLKQIHKFLKEKDIEKAITFGGKNSVYIHLVCKVSGIDSYIFEQNAIMGKANRFNSIFCKKIFSNFPLNKKKEVHVGNPNAFNIKGKKTKKLFTNQRITLLFTMGSLGSKTMDKVIEQYIENNKDYNIIYISGNNVKSSLKENERVKVYPFYNPLCELMSQADVIISRAGASTLSEIIALNKPSIIIPSPYVANNHQYKNAQRLFQEKACDMIQEKELNFTLLTTKIRNLTNNVIAYEKMKNNLKKFENEDSFEKIKEELFR